MMFDHLKRDKTLVYGSLYSLFSFFSRGMSFVLLIVLAKYIQPTEYGYLSLFSTVVTFLTYFVTFSCDGYVGISFFRENKENFSKDFSIIIQLGILSILLFSIIAIIAGESLAEELELTLPLLWIAIVVSFVEIIFRIYQNIYRLKEEILPYGIISCSNAILNFSLSILLVVTLRHGWEGRVESQLVCGILFTILGFIYFIKNKYIKFSFSWQRAKVILLWGLPLIPHMGAIWIRRGLDQYIINYNYSIYEVGLFSFALNITGVIIMIGSAFNDTNSVTFYKILSDKDLSNEQKLTSLKKQTKNIYAIIITATLGIMVSMPMLVYFGLPKYIPSLPYFFMLGGYGFIQCVYFLYCNYLFYYGKTKNLATITFGTSILHLLLSLILTPISLYLTAIVYIIVQATIVGLVYWQSQSLIKENLVNTTE